MTVDSVRNRVGNKLSSVGMAAASCLTVLLLGAAPAEAKDGTAEAVRMVLAGPTVMLLCLASLATIYLIAAAFRRQEALVSLAQSAAVEVGKGKILNTLWGILAEILLVTAGLTIAKMPQLSLLVLFIIFVAIGLAGMGICVTAAVAGRRLHTELAGGEISPLASLGVGLRLYLVASALPILGWILLLLIAANGVGSILTASTRGPVDE